MARVCRKRIYSYGDWHMHTNAHQRYLPAGLCGPDAWQGSFPRVIHTDYFLVDVPSTSHLFGLLLGRSSTQVAGRSHEG